MSIWDKPLESDSEESTSSNPRRSTGPTTRQSRPNTLAVQRGQTKRQDSNESTTKPATRYQRSQSQNSIFRKSTENSKAKTAKTSVGSTVKEGVKPIMTKSKSVTNMSNMSKSNSVQNLNTGSTYGGPSNASIGGKVRPMTRSTSKLKPSSKSTFYASTPNLAGTLDDTDDDDYGFAPNLKLYADISLSSSTPDLLDDDSVSVGSQSSDSSRGKPSSARKTLPDTKRFSTGTPSRKSNVDVRKSLPGRRLLSNTKLDDRDLMPPPPTTSVARAKGVNSVSKSKQEIFLKRATRKTTTFELTFDEAKNILKGKSGILTDDKSFDTTNPTTTISYTFSNSTSSSSCTYTTTSTSCVSSYSSPRSIPKVTTPPLKLTPNQIMIESEIDSTAAEIRRQNLIDSAFQNLASMEASPNDIPERDCTPSTSSYLSSSSVPFSNSLSHIRNGYTANEAATDEVSTFNSQYSWGNSNVIDSEENDSDSPCKSVRERIAKLNASMSPRTSASEQTKTTTTTQPTYGPGTGSKQVSPGSCSSPRSSGVGSSLDSEMAAKAFAGMTPPSDSEDTDKNGAAWFPSGKQVSVKLSVSCVHSWDSFQDNHLVCNLYYFKN